MKKVMLAVILAVVAAFAVVRPPAKHGEDYWSQTFACPEQGEQVHCKVQR